jgi:peptidylprolyl isomerase
LLPLKKSILLLSSIVLTTSLTSCATAENYACAGFETGAQVESISVTGALGEQPVVSFPSPLSAASIQSRVVIAGEGPVFTGRNLSEFEFAGYNGGSGQLIQQTSFDGTQAQTGAFGPGEVPNFCEALAGAKEGSRIVAIIPPDQAHSGEGVPALGVGAADAFIFVIDLKRVFLEKATGDSVAPEAGLPTVVTTADGVPGITIPKSPAPTELRVAQLIRGSGDLVEEGQLVTLHYSGFLWDSSEKFDSSWDSGQATQFQMQEGALIEGFLSAVIGQPVGSQVIAVIPPALGYGDAGAGSIPPGATLVFVIDILGTNN